MPINVESPRDRAGRMELGVNETLTFSVDWGTKYLEQGQEITASSWDSPDGLTVVSDTFSTSLSSVTLSWDLVALPDPLDRTVQIRNTVSVDGADDVEAVLEIVGVSHTGVPE